MATENFQINPYHGNFNPGTVHGQKLFERKTKGLPDDERLTLTKKDGPRFRQLIEAKAPEFGKCVKSIPIEFDNAGAIVKSANLLEDYTIISLERCQRQAHSRYATAIAEGDPVPAPVWNTRTLDPAGNDDDKKSFYDQVHSQVIAEWIKNVLHPRDYEKLLRRKKEFAFTNNGSGIKAYDGPTMLHIIFTIVDPHTVVGVDTF